MANVYQIRLDNFYINVRGQSKITCGLTCIGSSVFYEFRSIKLVHSLAGWTTRILTELDALEGDDCRWISFVIEHRIIIHSFD